MSCDALTSFPHGVSQGFYNMFTRCFARCVYIKFTRRVVRCLDHAYKVRCKASGTILQGVLRVVFSQHVYKFFCKFVYIMFTRCFARWCLEHAYKMCCCKVFGTCLQDVCEGCCNNLARSSARLEAGGWIL